LFLQDFGCLGAARERPIRIGKFCGESFQGARAVRLAFGGGDFSSFDQRFEPPQVLLN